MNKWIRGGRIVALVMAVVLVTTVMSGCNSNKVTNVVSSSQSSSQVSQANNNPVTIEYWQYSYDSKVKLIDKLIKDFKTKYPNITIEHKVFPYDAYYQKLAAAIATMSGSGKGPNVINFHSSLITDYRRQGVIQALPVDAKKVDNDYSPLVQAGKFEDKYYTLPVAVRTYALFYNVDLLSAAGYTISDLPKTWPQFAEMAAKLAKWKGSELLVAGCTMDTGSRLPAFYQILAKSFGGTLISDDQKKATLNSKPSLDALNYLINMYKVGKAGVSGFYSKDYTAFQSGFAAMHIDGSFRAATFASQIKTFKWGVAELPTSFDGKKATFGDYWTNSITTYTKGDALDASVKFMDFLATDAVMKEWTIATGEIGAKKTILEDADILKDPILSIFAKGLAYAFPAFSVSEYTVDQSIADIANNCVIGDKDPQKTLDEINTKMQTALDKFWAK